MKSNRFIVRIRFQTSGALRTISIIRIKLLLVFAVVIWLWLCPLIRSGYGWRS
ncbi:MAG: hypothetical protein IPG22_04625 [Acidobacteria bacterium]|nr:hypothetical protein [Acidobacteriota bacterium]